MPGSIPSAYLSMRRGLITFALVWQGAWLLSDPSLWPFGHVFIFEDVLLGFAWVSWLLLVVLMVTSRSPKKITTHLEVAIGVNLLLVVASASVVAIYSVGPEVNQWFLAASLFNLATGTAAIMIRDPWQWAIVVSIVIIEILIFIIAGYFDGGELGLDSKILYPIYSLSMGIAAASAQRMLLRRANVIDEMQDTYLRQSVTTRADSEINTYVESLKRQLHETVLNTLTAISRGSLEDSESSRRLIRNRARESARILSSVSSPAVLEAAENVESLIASLNDVLDECAQRGIEVQLLGSVDAAPPERVVVEVIARTREAITNALRHSTMTQLIIRVDAKREFCVEICDNGMGFDADEVSQGFGLGTLLKSNDNLRVDIDSHPSRGSTIRVCEIKKRNSSRKNPIVDVNPTLPLVLPILSAWFLFSVLSVVLSWSSFITPSYNILALILYAVVAVLLIRQSSVGPIRSPLILIGSLFAIVIYQLNERSGAIIGTTWTDWSSEAIVVLFFSISAAGTWWAWIVVGSVWLLIQENFPLEFIAPGFLLIMAGAFLGMQLRRTDRTRLAAMGELTNHAVISAFREKLTASKIEKFLGVVPHSSISLLTRISDGLLDPWEQSVQDECAVTESHLRRTIFHTRTKVDPISILSQDLSESALDQGILLDFSLDENFSHGHEIHDISEYLQRLMENLPRNSTARFSTGREAGGGFVRFVAQTSGSPNRQALRELVALAPWGKSEMLEGVSDACEFLWEGTLD